MQCAAYWPALPNEVIMPEARGIRLYCLITEPSRALQEQGFVKAKNTMSNVLLIEAAGA